MVFEVCEAGVGIGGLVSFPFIRFIHLDDSTRLDSTSPALSRLPRLDLAALSRLPQLDLACTFS